MKVAMSEESKRVVTISEQAAAKQIIHDLRDDDSTVEAYAERAVRALCGGCDEVFRASAEIAKNRRAWNSYADNSGELDVWINFFARADYHTIVEGGAYLTDIWNITGEETDSIHAHAYLLKYTR